MTSADGLAHYLTAFFSEHLPLRTGASRHTVLAYRDAWKLWLRFAATRAGRAVPDLRITDLDVDTALAFLDALESERHNAIATRNHRRTALQAFFRYLVQHFGITVTYFHGHAAGRAASAEVASLARS